MEFVASNPWSQLSNSKMKTQDVQPLDFMNLVTEDASSPTFESDSEDLPSNSLVVCGCQNIPAMFLHVNMECHHQKVGKVSNLTLLISGVVL